MLGAIIFLLALAASNSGSSVHTDTHAVTCESYGISWVGGTAPFNLTLQNAAPPGSVIETDTLTNNSLVWTPKVPGGTVVLFHINDSSGTLAETTHFVVENGTDTSCVEPANAFLASPGSARVNVTSSTGSTTPSSTPIPASPTSGSTSPPGSTVSETGASSKSSVAVAAIVTPISVVVLALVAGLVFLLWKRSRRFGNPPIEDPESIAGQSSPIDQYPSEKILPAVPTQPQVTAEELQRAIDRIQEMYAIMRQAQRSSASAGDSGRVVELQRQIEDLMADNAVLSGEAPPNYDP